MSTSGGAGQVVVVTGASSGIGAALAERLARDGTSLALLARRKDALDAVCARCGPNALAVVTDMTVRDDVRRAAAAVVARFGQIDVWVNNAGLGITRPVSELTDTDLDDMMLANVKSALYGMQEVLPHFKQRGQGQIINVSSVLGRMPHAPIRAAYSGAKHFLNALTANLRDELQPTHPGIHVTLVSPGVVRTEFGIKAMYGGPDSREIPNSQSAEEVAEVIAGVIAVPRPDVFTRAGSRQRVLDYLGGLMRDPE